MDRSQTKRVVKAADASTLYGRDWRIVIASCWDKNRQARHLDETKRLIAEGWNLEAAEYLAYEIMTKETDP